MKWQRSPYCSFPDSSTVDTHYEISQNQNPRNKRPQNLTSIWALSSRVAALGAFWIRERYWRRFIVAVVVCHSRRFWCGRPSWPSRCWRTLSSTSRRRWRTLWKTAANGCPLRSDPFCRIPAAKPYAVYGRQIQNRDRVDTLWVFVIDALCRRRGNQETASVLKQNFYQNHWR